MISAHSAYPSKTLFDYLLDMKEGDLFYIHVLDRVLEYRVDQIKTVLPNDVNDLYVVKGKDYVTLMTCTPYTVNTHRLLVRGERVPDDPDIVVEDDGSKSVNKTVKAVNNGRDSMYVLGYKLSYVTIIIGIGVFLLVVAAAVVLAVRRGRSRKNKGGERGFLLFPTVSNFIGQQRANSVIEEYSETLDHVIKEDEPETAKELGITAKSFEEALEKGEIDEEGYPVNSEGARTYSYTVSFEYDLDRLYSDSKEYNASIFHHQGTVDTINYEKAALDMSRYGLNNLYGYLSAPSIDLYLPVYLGANDSMMSYGAAHLSGTSLPIDEKNTNVAIAGHTGYIGRIFFDNIKRLDPGDTVSFTNYWETIDYEVIDFKTVAPNETGDIYIKDGRQLMTLITCTPDGHGGFGRYLVICEKK